MDNTRELFYEMVGEAEVELGLRPSSMALAYLVDLLDTRVRSEPPSSPEAPETLAEALAASFLVEGKARAARLRALGDRTLFQVGFFGPSLLRKTAGLEYFAQIGTIAYLRLSTGTRSELFEELGLRFGDFAELLADVGERARGQRSLDLLQLYDRYMETGRPRDRSRLIRHGLILPASRESGPSQ